MALSIEEVVGSRSGNSTSSERRYIVREASDEADVVAMVATLPSEVAGLPYADFDYEEMEEDDVYTTSSYMVVVKYGNQDITAPQAAGTSEFRFNFQAPSAHIYQALETVSVSYDEDLLPFGASDFGGAINVVWDDGKLRVEGFNLQPPAEVFSIPYVDVPAVITPAYLDTVKGLCGKVNDSPFEGAAAGEIMLSRAQGSRKNGLWNLEFGFSYVANATNIAVGSNIIVPFKDGLDLLWVYYGPTTDDTTKQLIRRPWAAFVSRVFERADLNDLNLP